MPEFLKAFLLVVAALTVAFGLLWLAILLIVWLNFVGGLWLAVPATIILLALFLTGSAFLIEGF